MRKSAALLVLILLTVVTAHFWVFASISVGVEEGDWIEYNVTYVGLPPEGHDVTWAKMEVLDVQDATITVRIISNLSSQKQKNQTSILNLETGHLIDDFIIPAMLETGDIFLDENKGEVAINGTGSKMVAGRERTVVFVASLETTTFWDKETGVAVEGYAEFPNFTMVTIANKTNMWEPQTERKNMTVYLLLGIIVVVSSASIAAIFLLRKKK